MHLELTEGMALRQRNAIWLTDSLQTLAWNIDIHHKCGPHLNAPCCHPPPPFFFFLECTGDASLTIEVFSLLPTRVTKLLNHGISVDAILSIWMNKEALDSKLGSIAYWVLFCLPPYIMLFITKNIEEDPLPTRNTHNPTNNGHMVYMQCHATFMLTNIMVQLLFV